MLQEKELFNFIKAILEIDENINTENINIEFIKKEIKNISTNLSKKSFEVSLKFLAKE
jgi:hypothetical protein